MSHEECSRLWISSLLTVCGSHPSKTATDGAAGAVVSRQDDDFSHHSQFIVQHAFVRVNAGAGEGDAEAGRTRGQRCLGQTGTILWKLSNESGMHNVGGRTHEGVSSAISIRGDVGGRRSLNRRVGLGTERDGVTGPRFCIRPFHRLANVDHLGRVHEAHDGDGLSSAAVTDNVPHSGSYLVGAVMM